MPEEKTRTWSWLQMKLNERVLHHSQHTYWRDCTAEWDVIICKDIAACGNVSLRIAASSVVEEDFGSIGTASYSDEKTVYRKQNVKTKSADAASRVTETRVAALNLEWFTLFKNARRKWDILSTLYINWRKEQ